MTRTDRFVDWLMVPGGSYVKSLSRWLLVGVAINVIIAVLVWATYSIVVALLAPFTEVLLFLAGAAALYGLSRWVRWAVSG